MKKFSLVILALVLATPAFAIGENQNQHALLCKKFANNLKNLEEYAVSYDSVGSDDTYPNLEVDGDGHYDTVIRSRGYGNGNIQTLIIHFSNGEKIQKEMQPFFLASFDHSLLAVESYQNIYLITPNSIGQFCNHK